MNRPDPSNRPLLIAHRGASSIAPENTLLAFRRAIELKADGIELDVQLTSDGVPICAHNDDLSQLTHHRGYLHQTPFATVRSLDVGSHKGPTFAGIQMPTLAEALELISPYAIKTIVEIKIQPGLKKRAAKLIGGMIADIKMKGEITISSFSPSLLREVRRNQAGIKLGLILDSSPIFRLRRMIADRLVDLAELHLSLSAINCSVIADARSKNRSISAWTANDAPSLARCRELGVDAIMTDDIAAARSILGQ